MNNIVIILIVVMLVVFAGIGVADQNILYASDDAGIVESSPDDNYGSFDHMWIGHGPTDWMNSLIRFELAGYTGIIVESAYLKLYVDSYVGDFPPDYIIIGRNGNSWDETTVTWNNAPYYADSRYITGPSSVNAWWVIEVTDFVGNWVDGTYDNYGFQIATNDTDFDYFMVRTKEASSEHPELELNYTYDDIRSTSMGCIKALFD
jgi:hypothetical protein